MSACGVEAAVDFEMDFEHCPIVFIQWQQNTYSINIIRKAIKRPFSISWR